MLTAVLDMLAANDVGALSEKKPRYQAVLGIDAVRQTLHRLVVAGVNFGKGSIADVAGEDNVEGRNSPALRGRLRSLIHRWRRELGENGEGGEGLV